MIDTLLTQISLIDVNSALHMNDEDFNADNDHNKLNFKFNNYLTEKQKFVMIKKYKSDINKEFNETANNWRQIQNHNHFFFHSHQNQKCWDSVLFKIAVIDDYMVSHLNLCIIVKKNGQKNTVHVKWLNFYSGDIHGTDSQIMTLQLFHELNMAAHTDNDFDGMYCCKFNTYRGIGSFFRLSKKSFIYNVDTEAMFWILQELTHQTIQKLKAETTEIILKICVKVCNHQQNKSLWRVLKGLTSNTLWLWHQYMCVSRLSKCQFEIMMKWFIIICSISLIHYSVINFFMNMMKTEVKLTYST